MRSRGLLAGMVVVAALEIITMSPRGRSRIGGMRCLHKANAPSAWVRNSRSTSAGSVSTTLNPRDAIPALCTRMSTGPSSSSARVASASHSSGSSTDARTATARRPSALIALTVSSAASSSRR